MTTYLTAVTGFVKASCHFHRLLVVGVLRCPSAFFDSTPTGRILNRFSKDVAAIDEQLPTALEELLDELFECLAILVVVSLASLLFLVAAPFLIALYFLIQVQLPRQQRPVVVVDVYALASGCSHSCRNAVCATENHDHCGISKVIQLVLLVCLKDSVSA